MINQQLLRLRQRMLQNNQILSQKRKTDKRPRMMRMSRITRKKSQIQNKKRNKKKIKKRKKLQKRSRHPRQWPLQTQKYKKIKMLHLKTMSQIIKKRTQLTQLLLQKKLSHHWSQCLWKMTKRTFERHRLKSSQTKTKLWTKEKKNKNKTPIKIQAKKKRNKSLISPKRLLNRNRMIKLKNKSLKKSQKTKKYKT